MRKVLFTISLIVFCLGVTFAQEFKVDYKIQYKYTHHSNLAAIKNGESESLYLFTGENQSIFGNHNFAYAEEIENKKNEMINAGNFNSDDWGIKHTSFLRQYYKNHDFQEVWILAALDEYSNKYSYGFVEDRIPLEWKVLEETKEFLDYTVQAATTDFAGRSYTAWFTTEIPIPDGPHVFYGLPGLIVDVYDVKKHFRFQLEALEKVEEIRKLPDFKKITLKDFKKIQGNHEKMKQQSSLKLVREGAVEYTDKSGNTQTLTEAEFLINTKREKEDRKKNFNPMELE